MLPGFCSREHLVFKKILFKEFQDGCFMHGHFWYLNGLIWAIQCLFFALAYSHIDIRFGKKILFEEMQTAFMVAQHTNSASCESTIPIIMPYKLSHCALQICRWFLEFLTVQNNNLTTLSLSNMYMAEHFYTYWFYITQQHTKTLFCGEIIFQYL